jgi:uncharacterized membrane protein YfcA
MNHRHRKRYFLIVPGVVWAGWLAMMMAGGDRWHLFADNWFMTVTMCVGSFIAGATSEGGGAVAFPVMTLLFGIAPAVARDFSLIIQSVGMTAATVLILLFGIRIERRAIVFAGLGGAAGIVCCLEFLAPRMPPAYSKMFFTSLWLSFAGSLWWLNRHRDRSVAAGIADFGAKHAAMLLGIGFFGGIVSGLTGSGLDIMTFTLLTLYFRVCEKVATPTSVVLMAINAVVGASYCAAQQRLAPEALNYWYVCIPVVVVGAPLGAYFIHQRTRHFIAKLLYVSILVQFAAALLIVPQTPALLAFSAATVIAGALLFAQMAVAGKSRLERLEFRAATVPKSPVRRVKTRPDVIT